MQAEVDPARRDKVEARRARRGRSARIATHGRAVEERVPRHQHELVLGWASRDQLEALGATRRRAASRRERACRPRARSGPSGKWVETGVAIATASSLVCESRLDRRVRTRVGEAPGHQREPLRVRVDRSRRVRRTRAPECCARDSGPSSRGRRQRPARRHAVELRWRIRAKGVRKIIFRSSPSDQPRT